MPGHQRPSTSGAQLPKEPQEVSMSVETRYAQSGDVSIAYQVIGEGGLDVVLVPGAFTHLEHLQLEPRVVHLNQRLASFSRLIV